MSTPYDTLHRVIAKMKESHDSLGKSIKELEEQVALRQHFNLSCSGNLKVTVTTKATPTLFGVKLFRTRGVLQIIDSESTDIIRVPLEDVPEYLLKPEHR